MAQAPQQFCVRWNSYHTNLQTIFPKLLSTENFADVTLACENRQIRCHKVVLSACSQYFERLLVQNPCKHPIIFMKDMRFSEMQSLVDFMYKGEVNVTQDELPSLLKSAEALQIRGLCGSDQQGLSSENSKSGVNNYQNDSSSPRKTTLDLTGMKSPKSTISDTKDNTAPTSVNRTQNGGHSRVKQETVEEDGLFYGEMEDDEGNEQDDESGKPGSSQPSASNPFSKIKPENSLPYAQPNTAEYMARLSKMNPFEIQSEFAKYGFTTGFKPDAAQAFKSDYKTWIDQNDQLEIELLKKNGNFPGSSLKPDRFESGHANLTAVKNGANETLKVKKTPRRGRPPLFTDRFTDIADSSFKSDLDQFLEGKEISSSGLSRKDLEKVMMGKFNPNRRYSNEAMWAALMDVKRGGSIYRAAQTHKVPRKSLRNWMKRCHIKSSFPMPQQLKQFVENNKKQKEIINKYHNYTPSDFEHHRADTATEKYDYDFEFGKHFLSAASPVNAVSSEDDVASLGENAQVSPKDDEKIDEVLNMSVKE